MFYQGDELKGTSIDTKKCTSGINKQIHRINETGDITFVKTGLEHSYQTIPKLVLSGYKSPRFYHDKKGEYGVIGNDQHFILGSNLNKVEDYFKTKLSALLLTNIKYRQKFIEPNYYPDVRTIPIDKITDESLADYFGFTKEEREAIEATEYPKREYKFKEITCADLKGEKEEPKEGGSFFNKTRKHRRT